MVCPSHKTTYIRRLVEILTIVGYVAISPSHISSDVAANWRDLNQYSTDRLRYPLSSTTRMMWEPCPKIEPNSIPEIVVETGSMSTDVIYYKANTPLKSKLNKPFKSHKSIFWGKRNPRGANALSSWSVNKYRSTARFHEEMMEVKNLINQLQKPVKFPTHYSDLYYLTFKSVNVIPEGTVNLLRLILDESTPTSWSVQIY